MLALANKVREISLCSEETLSEDLLCSTTPVVLKGLVANWPLVKQGKISPKAAADYIQTYYNQRPVHLMRAEAKEKGRLFYNDELSGFNFQRQNTELDKVFGNIFEYEGKQGDTPTFYVGSTSVDHILPGFRTENDLRPLEDKPLISIWMGNQSRIAAHYDVTDNIACVAVGKRRFTLFPPEQLENLYVGPLDFTPAGQPASLVDFHQPDYERFPKFKTALAAAQVAELEAGDAIFIPSMWWHHVEALSDFNVLVNYWWRQVGNQLGAPGDALVHALLSIKDLPLEQRQAWRNIFDHYVFSPKEQVHIPEHMRGSLNPIDDALARQLRAQLINRLNR